MVSSDLGMSPENLLSVFSLWICEIEYECIPLVSLAEEEKSTVTNLSATPILQKLQTTVLQAGTELHKCNTQQWAC